MLNLSNDDDFQSGKSRFVSYLYNLLVGAEPPHPHFSNGLRKQSETQRIQGLLQFYLPTKTIYMLPVKILHKYR